MGLYNCSCLYKSRQARGEMHSLEKLIHTQLFGKIKFFEKKSWQFCSQGKPQVLCSRYSFWSNLFLTFVYSLIRRDDNVEMIDSCQTQRTCSCIFRSCYWLGLNKCIKFTPFEISISKHPSTFSSVDSDAQNSDRFYWAQVLGARVIFKLGL
jgi:hypothetical protein